MTIHPYKPVPWETFTHVSEPARAPRRLALLIIAACFVSVMIFAGMWAVNH